MNNQNNPQQDTEMSLEALEKKYSQMNAQQRMQNNPYAQYIPNMQNNANVQVPQTMGGINKKWLYIGGAVVAALLLITLANYKMTHSQPEDPTIGVSTTEYASQDTSTVVEGKTEEVEKEDSEVAEEVSDKSGEEASDSDEKESVKGDQSALENHPYEAFIMEGDTFKSNTLGIAFTKPSNLIYMSEKELSENKCDSAESYAQFVKQEVEDGKFASEMIATTSDRLNMVEVKVMRNLGVRILKYSGKSDEEIVDYYVDEIIDDEKLEELKEDYKTGFGANGVEMTITKEFLAGKPCVCKLMFFDMGGKVKPCMKEYMFFKNEYAGYVTILDFSEEACDKYKSCFTSIN